MATENNIVDINLSAIQKKKFRIDGDDSRIVELNTSDTRILGRMREVYPKLNDLIERMGTITDGVEESTDVTDELNSAGIMAERLEAIDKEMRDLVDYLFDTKISDIVAPDGSMYDLFNGVFRFEHIISIFIGLYEENMTEEFKKMQNQIKKHTAKYTKKYTK